MNILLTGASGQLGQELQRLCPSRIDCLAVGRGELDITDRTGVLERVGELQPQVIINSAAYTAVDGAEAKPDLAVDHGSHEGGCLCGAVRYRAINADTKTVALTTSCFWFRAASATSATSATAVGVTWMAVTNPATEKPATR